MTPRAAVTRLDLGPEQWLTAARAVGAGTGHRVAELLPAGYDTYLRLFHPFTSWRTVGRRTWRSLADEAGVAFHPELTWSTLRSVLVHDERGHRYQVAEGQLEPVTRTALYRRLQLAGADEPVFFYYRLAAMVQGLEPLLLYAPLSEVNGVRQQVHDVTGVDLVGPEYLWPTDRSWVVNTDYDLSSTYLACAPSMAAALRAEPGLEILPVTLDTRVDERADRLNRGVTADGES
jgi:hypothetical protein